MANLTVTPNYPSFTAGSIPFTGSDGRPSENTFGPTVNSSSKIFTLGDDASNNIKIGKVIPGFYGIWFCQSSPSETNYALGGYPGETVLTSTNRLLLYTGTNGNINHFIFDSNGLQIESNSSAKLIIAVRCYDANTAGNNLTITAGGATVGATDKSAGQLILRSGISTGTGEGGVTLQGMVAGSTGTADNSYQDMIKILGNKLGFYNVTPVVRPTALTTQLTTITHTEPGTPDYALQDMTMISPWGFASQDEGNTLLKVVNNLQTRMSEVETKLQALGLLT